MSIFNRIRDLLSANVNSMLDSAEDPEKMAEEYLRQLNNELVSSRESLDLIGFLTDAPAPSAEDQG